MIELLVAGAIAWALTGAVEDAARSWRGQDPRTDRRGLRGYLDDRWQALADHHHAVAASDQLTRGDERAARKHLARAKALKLAGFATEEDVARARAEHQHRLGFIAKGIDPDTMPPLFPARGKGGKPVPWEAPEETLPLAEPDSILEPEPPAAEPTVDDHFDTNADLWTHPGDDHEVETYEGGESYTVVDAWVNPDYFPPGHRLWGPDTELPDPVTEPQPDWSPFATSNTEPKENPMPNTGEITGPADVKIFHDDLKQLMDGAVTNSDTMTATASDLTQITGEIDANTASIETAAADMRRLGMEDAAVAAEALIEIQSTIKTALVKAAEAMAAAAAVITDQVSAAGPQLAVILAAHDAQLSVVDLRQAVGPGKLATDAYSDNAQ